MTHWHVGDDTADIYVDGKLVAQIPRWQYAGMIADMGAKIAKADREAREVFFAALEAADLPALKTPKPEEKQRDGAACVKLKAAHKPA